MGIDAYQFRTLIVRSVLDRLDGYGVPYSQCAENLLMGTAAQESRLGTFLVQQGGGPALGVFQMEPATHDDLQANYLRYQPRLDVAVNSLVVGVATAPQMVWNLRYACAMARIHYFRVKEPLPVDPENVQQLAAYWKEHWNTRLGKGTIEAFLSNYYDLVKS